ncbi:PilT/PilU family type 4a pilus ATPase [Candidatus Sumerlaeota bacterium]|nr:PilT/PilU family type 4a pilus ATPase [Candidatus Sumerlaeota bacterium]
MAVLDRMFDRMLETGASDLHVSEGQQPKLRLHGEVKAMEELGYLDRDHLRAMMKEICDPKRFETFEQRGDLDFAYAYENKARFRCNFNKQYAGYGAVFRTIPSRVLTLDELGAPQVLKTFTNFNKGLVLVTGPTGSGKSTTLAGVIDHINSSRGCHVITIEEPIEFVHPMKKSTIVQREVGIDTPSFADALVGATRQDADVILVGEMRDLETISLAVSAGETGTLVFGTLHTNSATKTIDRIVDVFPADQQLAVRQTLSVSLRAICAQLLLKRVGGKGRIAAHEILIQTLAVSNAIREAKNSVLTQTIMSNKALGMQLMDDVIAGYLAQGIIDGVEAYMKSLDKDRFKQFAPIAE